MKSKWMQAGLFCVAAGVMLTGCVSAFERVEEEAYRTERIEGVVVQDVADNGTEMETGRPQPTQTPMPPLTEQYDIPDTYSFFFESGTLTVTGTAEIEVPEGNTMAVYELTPRDFSWEQLRVLWQACCKSDLAEQEEEGMSIQIQDISEWESGECAQFTFYRNGEDRKSEYAYIRNYERMGESVLITDTEEGAALRAQAEAFLVEAGLEEDFCVYRIFYAKAWKELYLIDFVRLVDGIQVMENFGFSDAEIGSNNEVWPLEGMRLGIDAQGIRFFSWEAPFDVGEEEKGGELLPFPVIQQTMMTLLRGSYGSGKQTQLQVTRLQLCYRPRYTEEKGAMLLPVWNLYGTRNGAEEEKVLLCVNALTGEKMPYRSRRK